MAGREACRFRHQLIHDAAYQAIAKQSRAELHERFADWLESVLGDRLAEYRPIVGYHLEQAARYRRELDPADARLPALASRAADHLRAAGMAAQIQNDHAAAVNLLRRGLDLLPPESQQALEIRVMLAGSLGDVEDARLINAFLLETVELAERLRDPAAAARAETARLQVAGWLGEGEMVDLLGRAQSLRQTLENLGDEEGALAAGEREILMLFWLGRCGEALGMARSLRPGPPDCRSSCGAGRAAPPSSARPRLKRQSRSATWLSPGSAPGWGDSWGSASGVRCCRCLAASRKGGPFSSRSSVS